MRLAYHRGVATTVLAFSPPGLEITMNEDLVRRQGASSPFVEVDWLSHVFVLEGDDISMEPSLLEPTTQDVMLTLEQDEMERTNRMQSCSGVGVAEVLGVPAALDEAFVREPHTEERNCEVGVLGVTDPAPMFNVKEEKPAVTSDLKGYDELSQWKPPDEEACELDAPASTLRPGAKGNTQQHEQFLSTAPSAGVLAMAEHDGEEVESSALKITVAEAEVLFSQRHIEVMSELLEKCPCDPVSTLLSKYEVACRIKGISSTRKAISLARRFLHEVTGKR